MNPPVLLRQDVVDLQESTLQVKESQGFCVPFKKTVLQVSKGCLVLLNAERPLISSPAR